MERCCFSIQEGGQRQQGVPGKGFRTMIFQLADFSGFGAQDTLEEARREGEAPLAQAKKVVRIVAWLVR